MPRRNSNKDNSLISQQRTQTIDLYYLLHGAFEKTFGANASPEYMLEQRLINDAEAEGEKFTMSRLIGVLSPGQLLPTYKDWCYSPEWEHPRPIPRRRHSAAPFLPKYYVRGLSRKLVSLRQLEDGILKAAGNHALKNRALDILTHAISEAQNKQREQEAHIATLQPANEDGRVKEVLFREQDKLRLYRLRLNWLKEWLAWERPRVAAVGSVPNVNNFARIIKPGHLDKAIECLNPYLDDQEDPNAQNRILGRWYALMLWNCGATWADLRRIRKSVRSSDRPGCFASWNEIARKKYNRA